MIIEWLLNDCWMTAEWLLNDYWMISECKLGLIN